MFAFYYCLICLFIVIVKQEKIPGHQYTNLDNTFKTFVRNVAPWVSAVKLFNL